MWSWICFVQVKKLRLKTSSKPWIDSETISIDSTISAIYVRDKLSLKRNGAIQFEPTNNANIFKDFNSDLVGNLVRKLPAALRKFNNN